MRKFAACLCIFFFVYGISDLHANTNMLMSISPHIETPPPPSYSHSLQPSGCVANQASSRTPAPGIQKENLIWENASEKYMNLLDMNSSYLYAVLLGVMYASLLGMGISYIKSYLRKRKSKT